MGDVCLALLQIALVVSSLPGMMHLTFLSLKRKPFSLLKITEDGKGKNYLFLGLLPKPEKLLLLMPMYKSVFFISALTAV